MKHLKVFESLQKNEVKKNKYMKHLKTFEKHSEEKDLPLVNCNNCQNSGNDDSGEYICYCIRSNFWMLPVLDRITKCEYYNPIEDQGPIEYPKDFNPYK